MLMMILSVGVGGACGAILRYLASIMVTSHFEQDAWIATFSVNLLGCFIMGFLAGLIDIIQLDEQVLSPQLRTFLIVGFLGALTTFSSFALDFHQLLTRYGMLHAASYMAASVIGALGVFFLALWLAQRLLSEG